jgi:hypothetical protein
VGLVSDVNLIAFFSMKPICMMMMMRHATDSLYGLSCDCDAHDMSSSDLRFSCVQSPIPPTAVFVIGLGLSISVLREITLRPTIYTLFSVKNND